MDDLLLDPDFGAYLSEFDIHFLHDEQSAEVARKMRDRAGKDLTVTLIREPTDNTEWSGIRVFSVGAQRFIIDAKWPRGSKLDTDQAARQYVTGIVQSHGTLLFKSKLSDRDPQGARGLLNELGIGVNPATLTRMNRAAKGLPPRKVAAMVPIKCEECGTEVDATARRRFCGKGCRYTALARVTRQRHEANRQRGWDQKAGK